MKFCFSILFCLIINSVFSQDVKFLDKETMKNFSFFEIGKKKCPGSITENRCLRFINIESDIAPKKYQFSSCDFDLKYNFRIDDNLVLIYDDFESLKEELKISKNVLYNKVKIYNTFNFEDWNKKEIVRRKKFLITRYSSKNVKILKFRIKVYYLNNKILTNNILINRDSEDFINVVIPVTN